jgi:hypothetical protein
MSWPTTELIYIIDIYDRTSEHNPDYGTAAPPPELGSLDGKLRAMDDFAKAFLAD